MPSTSIPKRISVHIKNWEKYNIRVKGYVRPWWFSASNTMLEDPEIYELSAEEFRAWYYILSQASKSNSPDVEINFFHAERSSNVNVKALESLIQKFLRKSMLSESVQDLDGICTGSVQDLSNTRQDKQDKQDKQTNILSPEVADPPSVVIQEFLDSEDMGQLVQRFEFTERSQHSWFKNFETPYLFREATEMLAWLSQNPRRVPKPGPGAFRFVNGWFKRNYDKYQRTIPSNTPNKPNSSSAHQGWALFEK